jgi:hypothetical protein
MVVGKCEVGRDITFAHDRKQAQKLWMPAFAGKSGDVERKHHSR